MQSIQKENRGGMLKEGDCQSSDKRRFGTTVDTDYKGSWDFNLSPLGRKIVFSFESLLKSSMLVK